MGKVFWFICGCMALFFGVLGIVLPLMPTVPFALLAAWCFAKSNPRFEQWLVQHPRLGPPIIAWRTRRAVPRRAKRLAWLGMSISSLVSALLVALPFGLLPAAICTLVALWLWRLPDA